MILMLALFLLITDNWAIVLMSSVCQWSRRPGSIPSWVISKTPKLVLDAPLLSTQHYEVSIKGKVEQSREWSSALPYTGVVAIEKGAFGSLWLRSPTLLLLLTYIVCVCFVFKQSFCISELRVEMKEKQNWNDRNTSEKKKKKNKLDSALSKKFGIILKLILLGYW